MIKWLTETVRLMDGRGMGLETGRARKTRRQKWWPGGRVALYECGAVTPVHTKRMRGCPGWQDRQQEHGPRCRQSDALTAHKTSPAANGRAASTSAVCDLPPHLLGASPQIQFSPHPAPFTTLTLTHMTAGTSLTHYPPLLLSVPRQLAGAAYWVDRRPSSRHSSVAHTASEPSRCR